MTDDYGFVDRICDPGSDSLDHDDLTAWVQERLGEHRADVLSEAQSLPRRVRLDVVCNCGQPIGTWYDSIDEKYPFWCDNCNEYAREGAYPLKITATIEEQP